MEEVGLCVLLCDWALLAFLTDCVFRWVLWTVHRGQNPPVRWSLFLEQCEFHIPTAQKKALVYSTPLQKSHVPWNFAICHSVRANAVFCWSATITYQISGPSLLCAVELHYIRILTLIIRYVKWPSDLLYPVVLEPGALVHWVCQCWRRYSEVPS